MFLLSKRHKRCSAMRLDRQTDTRKVMATDVRQAVQTLKDYRRRLRHRLSRRRCPCDIIKTCICVIPPLTDRKAPVTTCTETPKVNQSPHPRPVLGISVRITVERVHGDTRTHRTCCRWPGSRSPKSNVFRSASMNCCEKPPISTNSFFRIHSTRRYPSKPAPVALLEPVPAITAEALDEHPRLEVGHVGISAKRTESSS